MSRSQPGAWQESVVGEDLTAVAYTAAGCFGRYRSRDERTIFQTGIWSGLGNLGMVSAAVVGIVREEIES